MKNKILLILTLVSLIAFTGCDEHHNRKHVRKTVPTKETVKSYRTHSTSNNNDWIYWYLLFDNNTRSYYYASSPSPVSSYSSLSWAKSDKVPEEIDEKTAENIGEQEVSTEQLGEAATEIQSDYSSIPENNSLDSMEGVPESDTSSGDTSSGGDSGGGDSGGGDAGGGDGGGGGE